MSKRLLLIEDNLAVAAEIASWLDDQGFAIHTVTSQQEALEAIESGTPFDLYITCIMLRRTREEPPDADTLGGFKVISQIPSDAKVLVCSKRGDCDAIEAHGSRYPSIVGYSYKPLDRSKWIAYVRQLLTGPV